MVRTISNLHSASLPRDARLCEYDTTGEFVLQVVHYSDVRVYMVCLGNLIDL